MAIASTCGYLVAMEINDNIPRPSWIQTASAIFVIGWAAYFIAVLFIGVEEDNRKIASTITSTVFSLAFIVSQYCGMFRYLLAGVNTVIVMLTLWIIGISIALIVYIAFTMLPTIPFVLLPVLSALAFIALAAIALRANWLWRETLQKAKAEGNLPTGRKSFSLLELMGATLLLACMIAPASYRAGTNRTLYAEDVSPLDAPFAAPSSAKELTFLRERYGAIRAFWYHDQPEFDAWLKECQQSPEVKHFHLQGVNVPEDVKRPIEPPYSNSYYAEVDIYEGKEATWDRGDRHIRIVWPLAPDGLPNQVFYRETSRH